MEFQMKTFVMFGSLVVASVLVACGQSDAEQSKAAEPVAAPAAPMAAPAADQAPVSTDSAAPVAETKPAEPASK